MGAPDSFEFGIAGTGQLDSAGRLKGTLAVVVRQPAIGSPDWDELEGFVREGAGVGEEANLHISVVQGKDREKPDAAHWRSPGAQGEELDLDALEARLNQLLFAERPALIARAHFIVPLIRLLGRREGCEERRQGG